MTELLKVGKVGNITEFPTLSKIPNFGIITDIWWNYQTIEIG